LGSYMILVQTSGEISAQFSNLEFKGLLNQSELITSGVSNFIRISSKSPATATHTVQITDANFQNYPMNLIKGEYLPTDQYSLSTSIDRIIFENYKGTLIRSSNILHNIVVQNVVGKNSLFGFCQINDPKNSSLSLKNITFTDSLATQENAGLFQNIDATLDTVHLENISAHIRFESSQVLFNNFICANNYNEDHLGGCIYLKSTKITLTNSSFINNRAKIGGAIYTESMKKISLDGNFSNNSAKQYGYTIASEAVDYKIVVNQKLTDYLNPIYYKYKLIPKVDNETKTWQIIDASPAMLNISTFYIILSDEYDQNVVYNISSPPLISSSKLNEFIYSNETHIALSGNNIHLDPKQNVTQIRVTLNYQHINETFILEFILRECLEGEFKSISTDLCELCPIGFYSLDYHQPCAQCPPHAICPGGAVLHVDPKFWRHPKSGLIFPCIAGLDDRCKGGSDGENQCEYGYHGALCQGCNYSANYVPNGNTCVQCNKNGFSLWLNAGGAILAGYLWELFSLYSSIVSIRNFVKVFIKDDADPHTKMRFKRKYYMGIQINFLTSFCQMFSIIYVYAKYSNIKINSFITELVTNIVSYISSPSSRQSSSLECLFLYYGVDPTEITFFKMKYWIMLPMVKLIVTIVLVMLLRTVRRIEDFRGTILAIFFLLILYEQPGLLLNLGRFSSCFLQDIDDIGFVQIDPRISCEDPQYLYIKESWALPAILIWGLAIPLCFFFLLIITRKSFNTVRTRKRFGALINSYKQSAFYWTISIMGLKLGIILSLSLIDEPTTAFLTSFLVILAYYLLLKHVQPYSGEHFMKMEVYSVLTYMVSVFILGYSANNEYDSLLIIGSIIIVSMNLFTILYIGLKTIGKCWENIKAQRESAHLVKFEEMSQSSQSLLYHDRIETDDGENEKQEELELIEQEKEN